MNLPTLGDVGHYNCKTKVFLGVMWLIICYFENLYGRMEEPTAATNVEAVLVLQHSKLGKVKNGYLEILMIVYFLYQMLGFIPNQIKE